MRPPLELTFAAAIRAARIHAGRTQADVALQAGVPVRTVQRAEQGRRRISLGVAAAITSSLGRSVRLCSVAPPVKRFSPTSRPTAPPLCLARKACSSP
ncbi:MAG: helix-turn-helix transcriptional regulator [Nocardioidaceae bacterium]|nr:helix-turn-helix transcriptional regulator [Nocardioidaceae bacterium]